MARLVGSITRLAVLSTLTISLCITHTAEANFVFGEATNVGPTVNSRSDEWDPSISFDGGLLLFNSDRVGGLGNVDIWASTRATVEDPWGEPENLGAGVNSAHDDADPDLSADRLSLYFRSDRPRGYGRWDLWVTTRATTSDSWGEPVSLGPGVNSIYDESDPSISADGLSLYFSDWGTRFRPGGHGRSDIWVTTRPTQDAPWGNPVNLGPIVNSAADDFGQIISSDGRMLLFGSDRQGGFGGCDLYMTTRPSVNDAWGSPVNLGSRVNTPSEEGNPAVSADGSILYFNVYRSAGLGASDIWQAPVIPIVDLSGDGTVDGKDALVMTDRWGTNDSTCDIGPVPWGDGVVDVEDLKVLADHLGEEVVDPTLVAH